MLHAAAQGDTDLAHIHSSREPGLKALYIVLKLLDGRATWKLYKAI